MTDTGVRKLLVVTQSTSKCVGMRCHVHQVLCSEALASAGNGCLGLRICRMALHQVSQREQKGELGMGDLVGIGAGKKGAVAERKRQTWPPVPRRRTVGKSPR